MILLLRGVDDMAIRRRLREVKDAADGGSGMLSTNLVQLEGRDVRPDDILSHAMTPPFLAPKRLIIVDAFLDRWQPRGDQRQPRSIEPFAPLFAAIQSGFPPTTDLVLRGGEVGDRNPMLKRLKELPGVTDEVHAELKGEPLLRYIREEAAARGIRLRNGPFRKADPLDDELRKIGDPAALLAATIHVEAGENEWRSDTVGLTNELDKLALYSMGREVTVDDVYELCSGARHAGPFTLADAIMDGNLRRALDTLRLLTDDGVQPQMIIGGLAGRYRALAGTAELVEEGASVEEIAKAMGRPGDYPRIRDDAIRRARRIRPAGVRASLETIVDLDRQQKLGEVLRSGVSNRADDDFVLELMVTRLARIAGGR